MGKKRNYPAIVGFDDVTEAINKVVRSHNTRLSIIENKKKPKASRPPKVASPPKASPVLIADYFASLRPLLTDDTKLQNVMDRCAKLQIVIDKVLAPSRLLVTDE